jgi:hypothetical protein
MQARPVGRSEALEGLQSSNVAHEPHTLLMQVWLPVHSIPAPTAQPATDQRPQMPEEHVSPEAQSDDVVQVHCIAVCVAAH